MYNKGKHITTWMDVLVTFIHYYFQWVYSEIIKGTPDLLNALSRYMRIYLRCFAALMPQ